MTKTAEPAAPQKSQVQKAKLKVNKQPSASAIGKKHKKEKAERQKKHQEMIEASQKKKEEKKTKIDKSEHIEKKRKISEFEKKHFLDQQEIKKKKEEDNLNLDYVDYSDDEDEDEDAEKISFEDVEDKLPKAKRVKDQEEEFSEEDEEEEETAGKKEKKEKKKRTMNVVYLGHVPHGFYEYQMAKYFQQFGTVLGLYMGRSKKTGQPKGFAFIEFNDPEVAKIVAETMNSYVLNGRKLVCKVVETPLPRSKRTKITAFKHVRQEINKRKINHQKFIKKYNSRSDKQVKKSRKALVAKDKRTLKKLESLGIHHSIFPENKTPKRTIFVESETPVPMIESPTKTSPVASPVKQSPTPAPAPTTVSPAKASPKAKTTPTKSTPVKASPKTKETKQ